jgi:hypothetical protein
MVAARPSAPSSVPPTAPALAERGHTLATHWPQTRSDRVNRSDALGLVSTVLSL